MKLKLSKKTMQSALTESVGMSVGEQRCVNHEDCPAGEDTRNRLYIKVTDDGMLVLAHCFNCGGSGGIRSTFTRRHQGKLADPVKDAARKANCNVDERLYTNAKSILERKNWSEWPDKYFLDCWDELAKVDAFDIRRAGIWTVFPRGSADSPTGWECRDIHKNITRNIYPEYADDTKLLIYNKDASRIGVVCEDPISAMKVSLAGYGGVALCGTNLSLDDSFKLSILFDKILVWLDNDKPEIMAQAVRIKDRLLMVTSDVNINFLDTDPKKYTLEYLRKQIEGAFK